MLPWRVPSVPFGTGPYPEYVARLYRCLISETMLQQTQVKTVIAYYTKWLQKFPSIEDLAAANEEEVMACWAGLGYYSRAKRLQQAAQYLVSHYVAEERQFPRDPEEWIKHVPGVGPYTAGAILSISFGIPSAIVDGNVQRVLSRFLAIHGDTSTPKSPGSKLIWERAGQLVTGEDPGLLNQSLMELGATICTPTLPSCSQCPISSNCLAFSQSLALKPTSSDFFALKAADDCKSTNPARKQSDIEDLCHICPTSVDPTISVPSNSKTYIQNLYPYKPPKKAQRLESSIVTVFIRQSTTTQIYLEKKDKGLLSGLFDFPTTLLPPSTETDAAETLALDHCTALTGAKLKGTTTHLFTHIRRTSYVVTISLASTEDDDTAVSEYLAQLKKVNGSGRWIDVEKVSELGVSELCLKNLRLATSVAPAVSAQGKRKIASHKDRGSLVQKKIKASKDRAAESTEAELGMSEKESAVNLLEVTSSGNEPQVATQRHSDNKSPHMVNLSERVLRKQQDEQQVDVGIEKKEPRKSKIFDMFQRRGKK